MMIVPRKVVKLLPVLFLLSGPVWLPQITDFLRPRGEFDQPDTFAQKKAKTFAMEDVLFIQSRGGEEETRFSLRRVSSDDRDKSLGIEEVDGIVFDKKRRPIRIAGSKGNYDVRNKELTLRGDALVKTPDGYELHAPSLRYLVKKKKVDTAERIRVIGKNITIRGKGLSYDVESGAFRIGGRLFCKIW